MTTRTPGERERVLKLIHGDTQYGRTWCGCYEGDIGDNYEETRDEVVNLVLAYGDTRASEGRIQALEESAKVNCFYCEEGSPSKKIGGIYVHDHYDHGERACRSEEIRALLDKLDGGVNPGVRRSGAKKA